jgi:hypothetical protein
LVPAHQQCAAQNANAQHGPPLASPSCSPSKEESATLTVGTPDKNGFGANASGSATFKVICTDGQQPPCPLSGETEDVSISISMTDVRCATTAAACPGGFGSDYVGRVLAVPHVRITDKLNGTLGTGAGTAADVPLNFPISCAATTATDIGSTCSLSTTADALYPGIAQEQSRAVWQLNGFSVYDAGANGTGFDTGCPPACGDGDEQVFQHQGLFTP